MTLLVNLFSCLPFWFLWKICLQEDFHVVVSSFFEKSYHLLLVILHNWSKVTDLLNRFWGFFKKSIVNRLTILDERTSNFLKDSWKEMTVIGRIFQGIISRRFFKHVCKNNALICKILRDIWWDSCKNCELLGLGKPCQLIKIFNPSVNFSMKSFETKHSLNQDR